MRQLLILSMFTIFMAGCHVRVGDDPGKGGDPVNPPPANRVQWDSVAAEFNPQTEDFSFKTDGIEQIDMDLFGFHDDVEVVYQPELPRNTGFVRIFKVFKESASWGNFRTQASGRNLQLKNSGVYQCSIRVENGRITELKGGCYVRILVFLPPGAQIEVYNVGQLISARFFAMNADEFIKRLKAAWSSDRFAVIEDFVNSNQAVGRKAELSSEQLGVAIHEFLSSDDKFKVLRRLHPGVTDRGGLRKMIESEFSYFDREEAYKIAGV